MLFRERQLMNSFKLGDWVISTKYPKANPIKIQHQHAIDTGIFGTYTNTKGQANLLYSKECKLWQPKVGEWVVIADDITPDLYAVFQFNNHSKDKQILPLVFLQTLKDQS